MTLQDFAALAVCLVAGAWLLWRVFLAHGPSKKKPDVTTEALLKSTRARKAGRATTPADGCH